MENFSNNTKVIYVLVTYPSIRVQCTTYTFQTTNSCSFASIRKKKKRIGGVLAWRYLCISSHKGHSQSKISFSLMVNRMEARSRHFDIYYLRNKLKIEQQWLILSCCMVLKSVQRNALQTINRLIGWFIILKNQCVRYYHEHVIM